jgi:hypothetical protein
VVAVEDDRHGNSANPKVIHPSDADNDRVPTTHA